MRRMVLPTTDAEEPATAETFKWVADHRWDLTVRLPSNESALTSLKRTKQNNKNKDNVMNKYIKNALESATAFGNKVKDKASEVVDGLLDTGAKALVWAGGALGLGGAFATKAQAQASAYVEQMEDAATQMTTDLGAILPIALGVAVVSVGVFIVWRIFKRLANG